MSDKVVNIETERRTGTRERRKKSWIKEWKRREMNEERKKLRKKE